MVDPLEGRKQEVLSAMVDTKQLEEQEVLSATMIVALHTLSSIMSDETHPVNMRMEAAGTVLAYASSFDTEVENEEIEH